MFKIMLFSFLLFIPEPAYADINGYLLLAASKGKLPIIQKLLEKGADIDYRDKRGYTPLMQAVIGDRMEVIRYLEKEPAERFKNCSFTIHTWNERCGLKMAKRLVESGFKVIYKPFGV